MSQELSLFDVTIGTTATITTANVGATLGRRLREFGLREGASVTVLQKTAGGGRVVRTRGTHYALDGQALRRIAVEPAL